MQITGKGRTRVLSEEFAKELASIVAGEPEERSRDLVFSNTVFALTETMKITMRTLTTEYESFAGANRDEIQRYVAEVTFNLVQVSQEAKKEIEDLEKLYKLDSPNSGEGDPVLNKSLQQRIDEEQAAFDHAEDYIFQNEELRRMADEDEAELRFLEQAGRDGLTFEEAKAAFRKQAGQI